MPNTPEQISYQLATKLSPPGALATSLASRLRAFWLGVADELARVYSRTEDLLREARPSTTVELLTDWEDEYDLPDPCVTGVQTVADRRAALIARANGIGGQSAQYFRDIAQSFGVTITITEHHAFEVGRDGMGDGVGGDEWAFVWEVTAPAATAATLREVMECVFERLQPAHTVVWFTYV